MLLTLAAFRALVLRLRARYELQFYPLQRERYGAQIWRTASNSIVDTEFTIDDLPHNMPFQFRMRAHNPYGWSGFSALSDAYATTPSPPEALERPPVATILDGGTVRLEWPPVQEDNGAPVEVYNVRGTSGCACFATALQCVSRLCHWPTLRQPKWLGRSQCMSWSTLVPTPSASCLT